jgi:hypothetical protein
MLGLVCIIHHLQGQNNSHKYYLEGQLSGGLHQSKPVAGVGGAFGFFISPNSSIDLRSSEIYNVPSATIIGAISITYRHHFNNGFFAGGGFAHHHELSKDYYMENPAEATLGSHGHIFHRSGVSVTAGYNFKPITSTGFFSRVYPTTNILVTWMALDHGYNPLVTANVGLRIGLKKM